MNVLTRLKKVAASDFTAVGPNQAYGIKSDTTNIGGKKTPVTMVKTPTRRSVEELAERSPMDKAIETMLLLQMIGGQQGGQPHMTADPKSMLAMHMLNAKTSAHETKIKHLTGGSVDSYAKRIMQQMKPEHYEMAGPGTSDDVVEKLVEEIIPQQILHEHATRVGHGNPDLGKALLEAHLRESYFDKGQTVPSVLRKLLTSHISGAREADKFKALTEVSEKKTEEQPRHGADFWRQLIEQSAPKADHDPFRVEWADHQDKKTAASIPYQEKILREKLAAVTSGFRQFMGDAGGVARRAGTSAANYLGNSPKLLSALAIGGGTAATAGGIGLLHHLLSGAPAPAASSAPTMPALAAPEAAPVPLGPTQIRTSDMPGGAQGADEFLQRIKQMASQPTTPEVPKGVFDQPSIAEQAGLPMASPESVNTTIALPTPEQAPAAGGFLNDLMQHVPGGLGGAALGAGGALGAMLLIKKLRDRRNQKDQEAQMSPDMLPKFGFDAASLIGLLAGGAGTYGLRKLTETKGPDLSGKHLAIPPFYESKGNKLTVTPDILEQVLSETPAVGQLARAAGKDTLKALPTATRGGFLGTLGRFGSRMGRGGPALRSAQQLLKNLVYATHGNVSSPKSVREHTEAITGLEDSRAGQMLADVLRRSRGGASRGALGPSGSPSPLGSMNLGDSFTKRLQDAVLNRTLAGTPLTSPAR